jgi:hypothetical protein
MARKRDPARMGRMSNPTKIERSASGVPIGASIAELAAAQAAVGAAYDEWADGIEVAEPAGETRSDEGLWPESANATDAQLADLNRKATDAVASAGS